MLTKSAMSKATYVAASNMLEMSRCKYQMYIREKDGRGCTNFCCGRKCDLPDRCEGREFQLAREWQCLFDRVTIGNMLEYCLSVDYPVKPMD